MAASPTAENKPAANSDTKMTLFPLTYSGKPVWNQQAGGEGEVCLTLGRVQRYFFFCPRN